jgi:hypothetical protein
MNLRDIAIERLYSQHIEGQRFKFPDELVAWLGAVQAQDYAGAKWSIGLRLHGTTDKDIENALTEKKIVRTWALRGTLHFVAASDIQWILSVLAPRIIKRNTRRYNELKIDEKTLYHSNKVLKTALDEENQLNRRELLNILEQKGISTEGQRASYMLQRASLDGLICQGVAIGNNPTYMSMDDFPKPRKIKRENALAELAKRYFTSHGPATIQDFVWWSGLLVKDAREGLEIIKSELKKVVIEAKTYWMSPKTSINYVSPKVKLLPGFDEYLLGYRNRSASIEADKVKKMLPPANGIFRSTIIVDGLVSGTWKRTFDNDKVLMAMKYFKTFNPSESEALTGELLRYSNFIGLPVSQV